MALLQPAEAELGNTHTWRPATCATQRPPSRQRTPPEAPSDGPAAAQAQAERSRRGRVCVREPPVAPHWQLQRSTAHVKEAKKSGARKPRHAGVYWAGRVLRCCA